MPNIKIHFENLKIQAPNACKDIFLCYETITKGFKKTELTDFQNLPFVLQLGVFRHYFSENGLDLDFNNLSDSELAEQITNLIISHENVVKHYS